MQQSLNKISLRQALFLLITIVYSPLVRIVGSYTANEARQAAWVSGIFSVIALIILFGILSVLLKRYREQSFMDIIKDILGNIPGKILISLYAFWILILIGLYTRYFAERIVSTIMPNTAMSIFIIPMLLLVVLAVGSGLTVIARMNEIIILVINIFGYIALFFATSIIEVKNLIPIYYTDILPAFKGSMVMWAMFGYFIIIMFFNNQISNKEKFFRHGMYANLFLVLINTFLIICIIGVLSWSVAVRVPFSTFMMFRQITVFGIIQRIESFLVTVWVMADFVIIAVFTYALLYILRDFFKLRTYKPLIGPIIVLIYIMSFLLASDSFELSKFSNSVIMPVNITFEYFFPLLLLIVGKIRGKV